VFLVKTTWYFRNPLKMNSETPVLKRIMEIVDTARLTEINDNNNPLKQGEIRQISRPLFMKAPMRAPIATFIRTADVSLTRKQRRKKEKRRPPLAQVGIKNGIFLYVDSLISDKVQKPPPQFFEVLQIYGTVACTGAGNIAAAITTDPIAGTNLVPNWATRYATLFREYRINRVVVHTVAMTGSAGLTWWTIDDINGTVPTLNAMEDQGFVETSNAVGVEGSRATLEWNLQNISEASWIATTVSEIPFYLKVYTDNANLLTPAVAVQLYELHIKYYISFRGRV